MQRFIVALLRSSISTRRFVLSGVCAVIAVAAAGCGGSSSSAPTTSSSTNTPPFLFGTTGGTAPALEVSTDTNAFLTLKGVPTASEPSPYSGYTQIPVDTAELPAYQVTPPATSITSSSGATIAIQIPYSNVPSTLTYPFEALILTYDTSTSAWIPVPGSLTSITSPTGSSQSTTFSLTGSLLTDDGKTPGTSSSGIYAVFAYDGPPAVSGSGV
jgi:hypothetical protein